ncbi:unnamed protein product [Calypogeia fissa]
MDGDLEPCLEDTEEDFKVIGMQILNLALPTLGTVLSDPLMSLIDTCCVGQLSSFQLAALGPNTLIFNFVFQVFSFLGSTTCNFMASMKLKSSTTQVSLQGLVEVSRVLRQALCLAGALGLGVTLVIEVLAYPLLAMMGTGLDYMLPAITYLRLRALSAPAVLILIVGQGACLGQQDAKTPLLINFMTASVNLVGDLALTLWAKWGVTGAAVATLCANYLGALLMLRALREKSCRRHYPTCAADLSGAAHHLSSSPGSDEPNGCWLVFPTWEVLRPFYNMAGPLMLRCTLGMIVYTIMGNVAAQIGTLSIAAHQVAMQVFWTLSYFPESLSISAQALIAHDLTTKPKRATVMARILLLSSLALGLVLVLIMALLQFFHASWLSEDDKVVKLIMGVTKQSMLSELLCSVVIVIEGIAIASGDIGYLPRMQVINIMVVLLGLLLAYTAGWGLPGVWWCLVLYFSIRGVYHTLHILASWQTHVLSTAPFKLNVRQQPSSPI